MLSIVHYKFLALKQFYTHNSQLYSIILKYSIVKDQLIQFKDPISLKNIYNSIKNMQYFSNDM